MRTLVEALPSPVWARDEAGKLIYVNPAYARSVEAKDSNEVVQRGTELFDRASRADLFRAHEAEQSFTGRMPAIVAGGRVTFDVMTFPTRHGSAEIGIDTTDIRARRDPAHGRPSRTPIFATGVAISAPPAAHFYNTAFRLFDSDATSSTRPTDLATDRLRERGGCLSR
jgi:PAS domain-containing protein